MLRAKGERDYQAYLLRLWRAGSGESARWHASLQEAHKGQRMEFASLDDLVAFLKQRMGEEKPGTVEKTEGDAGYRRSHLNEYNKEKYDE